jgi:hypothetical protein
LTRSVPGEKALSTISTVAFEPEVPPVSPQAELRISAETTSVETPNDQILTTTSTTEAARLSAARESQV